MVPRTTKSMQQHMGSSTEPLIQLAKNFSGAPFGRCKTKTTHTHTHKTREGNLIQFNVLAKGKFESHLKEMVSGRKTSS